MTIETEKKEDTGCFFKFIGSCIGVLVLTVLLILKLTNVIDWSWNWVILALIIAVCILAYAAFHFFASAIGAGFENKFPMDKYGYLKHIANSDKNLQKQKDEFVSKIKAFLLPEYMELDMSKHEIYIWMIDNSKHCLISKNIQDKDIDVYDVIRSIDNLIYPNQKYSSMDCPDCGEKPFWILGEGLRNNDRKETIMVRSYAICSRCAQIVHYYDESIYDREVFERIKKLTEKNNENFKNLYEAETAHKASQMKDKEC